MGQYCCKLMSNNPSRVHTLLGSADYLALRMISNMSIAWCLSSASYESCIFRTIIRNFCIFETIISLGDHVSLRNKYPETSRKRQTEFTWEISKRGNRPLHTYTGNSDPHGRDNATGNIALSLRLISDPSRYCGWHHFFFGNPAKQFKFIGQS